MRSVTKVNKKKASFTFWHFSAKEEQKEDILNWQQWDSIKVIYNVQRVWYPTSRQQGEPLEKEVFFPVLEQVEEKLYEDTDMMEENTRVKSHI